MKIDSFKELGIICPEYLWADFNNKYQLYNLIEWVLLQSGPSEVVILSFSISEEFIRKIHKLKSSGQITRANLILDFKAAQKSQKLTLFTKNVFDKVSYCKSHAKIVLIKPTTENFPEIIITGSQNATRGNRHESTIISTSTKIINRLKQKIEELKSIEYGIHSGTN